MEHTKDKWEICFDGQIDCNGKKICSGLGFECYKEFNENAEAKDNARLIAAAPDLLDACMRAKKLLDEVARMNIQPFPISAAQLNRDLITILSSLKKLPPYFVEAESEV